MNTLKKEIEESKEMYPWLDKNEERKYMADREILDNYINLDTSCLMDTEKMEVRDMLYEYKDAFSLMDKIGTCPNIEVEINIMDSTPFFLDHTMQKRKTKYIGQTDEETMLLGYFKGRFVLPIPAQ